jgi:hypothetical protein
VSIRRRRYALFAATLAAAALTTSIALAATQQNYTQKFTVKKPGQSTGMSFRANQPGAQAVSAKKVTLTFPAGTKINTGALAKCTNPSSCPAKSKLGTGTATVILGTAQLPLGATAYNRAGGIALVVMDPTNPTQPIVLKPVLVGNKLILNIPTLTKGPFTLILADLSVTVQKIGSGSKAYMRTPATCAKGGTWTFTGQFDYVDGTSQTKTSKSACVKH